MRPLQLDVVRERALPLIPLIPGVCSSRELTRCSADAAEVVSQLWASAS